MARTWRWRLVGTTVVALCGVAFGGLSFAQQSQPEKKKEATKEEQQAEPTTRTEFVEQITVTAQKRTEDVQEVPISISTLAGQDLLALTAGGPDIRFLSARAPSLILESSFGRAFPRFYMRGLGNTDFDLNASQPVSMLVDDVVLENPVVKGMPIWDLDRIEVLRGPQGTLFGRNTPAGVVKFESKKPTKDLDGAFRLSYGSLNTVDVDGGVGMALSETVYARFSALLQTRSDWIKNAHTGDNHALGGHDEKAARLQFLWQPNEQFSGLLNLHGWDLNGTARVFRANIIKHGTNELVDDFRQDTVYQDGLNEQKISGKGLMLKLNYDFGAATLTSVTGYERIDDMYSRGDIDGGFGAVYAPPYGPGFIPFTSESADGIPSLDQITEEVRLTSNTAGPFRWLAGVYYFNEDLNVDSFSYDTLAPGNPQNGYATQTQQTDAYALFGSIDYDLSDKWSLKAGLRYSKDKKDFAADRPQPLFQPPLVAPITKKTDSDNVSWDLSGTYKVNSDVNVFGRLATGFRAPSIQGRIMFAPDFEGGTNPATNGVTVANEEKITSFEVGIKSILADHRLRLNLEGYSYRVDGQQVTAVGGQYNVATLLNVDKTDGYGFESDIEIIPSANWWINTGLSYNSTKFDDPNLTVAECGGGCTTLNPVSGPAGSRVVHINGNPLPHAPKWIFGGSINFQSSPIDRGYFASLDWSYYSKKYFFLYKSAEFQGDGYELGLRLGYGWNQGKYEVALYGRNITNKVLVEGGIDFDNLTGYTNDPRTVGLEFNVKL